MFKVTIVRQDKQWLLLLEDEFVIKITEYEKNYLLKSYGYKLKVIEQ